MRSRVVCGVQRRLESAKETMGEASGLAELMESVEDVFAGTDLKLMASTLVRMRRGLKVRAACKFLLKIIWA